MNDKTLILHRPQGPEGRFLRSSQALGPADIQAGIRSGGTQCGQAFPGLHIPKPNRFVITATNQETAVGAEVDRPD